MSSAAFGRGAAAPPAEPLSWSNRQLRFSVLLAGLAAIVVPTLISLGRHHWSTESGAHGPLILISGIWLLWRDRRTVQITPRSVNSAWLAFVPGLLLVYIYARSASMLGTETAVVYLLLVLLGFFYWGPAVMRRLWFPILYLGFLVKPPYGLVTELTQPLKIAISDVSVNLLHALGYPIASSGVLIQVAQYELLVKQACAGLGSLVTLMALGLLYVHLTGPSSQRRNLTLLVAIVPIALAANLLRVIILILLTYHFGDAVAQSFAHDVAGVVTFALSFLGLLGLDSLLARFDRKTA